MTETLTAYRWKGGLFCEGDIVDTLLDDSPWDAWLEENPQPDANASVEDALDSIAQYFGIDRKDADAHDFPVLVEGPIKPPEFCTICMKWFS